MVTALPPYTLVQCLRGPTFQRCKAKGDGILKVQKPNGRHDRNTALCNCCSTATGNPDCGYEDVLIIFIYIYSWFAPQLPLLELQLEDSCCFWHVCLLCGANNGSTVLPFMATCGLSRLRGARQKLFCTP
jgi:hypothetical protein